jgi:xyloglucan galactosyltransferase MUR3
MTRRSAFDTILTGCMPVFFHLLSAYEQYKVYRLEEHDMYSVLILRVCRQCEHREETLRRIPPDVVERMTQTEIRLIPRLVYADPRSKRETVMDAVDVTLEANATTTIS